MVPPQRTDRRVKSLVLAVLIGLLCIALVIAALCGGLVFAVHLLLRDRSYDVSNDPRYSQYVGETVYLNKATPLWRVGFKRYEIMNSGTYAVYEDVATLPKGTPLKLLAVRRVDPGSRFLGYQLGCDIAIVSVSVPRLGEEPIRADLKLVGDPITDVPLPLPWTLKKPSEQDPTPPDPD